LEHESDGFIANAGATVFIEGAKINAIEGAREKLISFTTVSNAPPLR
jgi:hypothetical protein